LNLKYNRIIFHNSNQKMDELKNLVIQTLETNGILGQLRA